MTRYLLFLLLVSTVNAGCQQEENCLSPNCYCSSKWFPKMNVTDIPQMVYFGFDDAVNSLINEYYDEIFTNNRNNPNGCPITMSLYVSDLYTDYKLVKKYYDAGHEIGVHGVNDKRIDTAAHLSEEAKQQRDNLIKHAEVKTDDIVGWRSPFLTSAGEEQPRI
ncbi:chitin deacetylase 1-like [Octopus sinensis]|nr:chitin deacetylase 1-like [Octopus sinensis]